jgi:hypothetical protein
LFGSGREGEEAQIRLPAALGHAAKELLHILAAFIGRALARLLTQALAAKHFLQVRRRLAAL